MSLYLTHKYVGAQLLLTESDHISKGQLAEAWASPRGSILSVCHLPAV